MARIGFVGVGNMGLPMAANLLRAGHSVKVFDVKQEPILQLQKQGAIACEDIAAACDGVDFFISMLPDDKLVTAVYCGDNGVFHAAKPNTVLLECSTIAVSTARDLHKKAREKGFLFFDAPVSGGTAGAKAASLSFMVGGERDKFSLLEPILKAMGKNIYYAGTDGAGQAAKICNNIMLAMHMLGTCEGLLLGEQLGVDMKTLFEICNHSSGQSWSLSHYCPMPGVLPEVPASHDYRPGFMGKMMLKDLKLAVNAASHEGLSLPMLDKALALYQTYCDAGNAERDFSGIIQMERAK